MSMKPTGLKARRMRVKDFVAQSLHEIANHSSDSESLHKAADVVASSSDQTMVTILEEPTTEETAEPSVYEKRGIVFLD